MRIPRFRVRTLIALVALVGITSGGGIEFVRLRRLSQEYAYKAWGYSSNVRTRMKSLARAQADLKKLRDSVNPDPVKIELAGVTLQWIQAEIAANANLVQIYEHAASRPWESPPEFAEAGRPDDYPITKRLMASPQPPEPEHPLARPLSESPPPSPASAAPPGPARPLSDLPPPSSPPPPPAAPGS